MTGRPSAPAPPGLPEPACGVASGRSLDRAGSGRSLATGSGDVTAGFADDDVPVRPADVGEPATDRTGLAASLILPVRGDAGVAGGHHADPVGDQGRDV